MASLVCGCLITTVVSLGSTCGSWVAVTTAAVADSKPVAGLTCASWGYPAGRRAHMEARCAPTEGCSSVCLKRQSSWVSFQHFVYQDIVWQGIAGALSIAILIFKFPIRRSLGFGRYTQPATWIIHLCQAAAVLGTLIDLQLLQWSWTTGNRGSFMHAVVMIVLEVGRPCSQIHLAWSSWNRGYSEFLVGGWHCVDTLYPEQLILGASGTSDGVSGDRMAVAFGLATGICILWSRSAARRASRAVEYECISL